MLGARIPLHEWILVWGLLVHLRFQPALSADDVGRFWGVWYAYFVLFSPGSYILVKHK